MARRHEGLNFLTVYGPTENTTFSTYYPVCKDFDGNIPIGRPISNSSVFIIDEFDNLQPIGVVGEICVGGAGVAKGYLNNQELTAQKFSNNPFVEQDRIYRTGDLGKWLPDGSVEYIGRKDTQVKIRGYRIEPKEIEAVLLENPSVKNAAVTIFEDMKNSKHLCAYYVSDQSIEYQELRRVLQDRLPDYMVPAFFIELSKLPLTANGKLDKQALPAPETDTRLEEGHTLPGNEIEELLTEVFKEILGVGQVSTNASFFDLGGDSIKALQISAKLHALNLKMEVKDLFKYPTIQSISSRIEREVNEEFQEEIVGEVRLTPIQEWFFEKQSMEHHWNQAILLHSEKTLEEKYVKEAMIKLVEHHDALRMSFKELLSVEQENRGITCAEEELFHFEIFNLTGLNNYESEITKKAEYLHKKVNLQKGPLVSIGLFKTDIGDFLLFSVHHLVIDGVSWRIIVEDFIKGYESMMQEKNFSLPKKTASYQAWASALETYSRELYQSKEEEYWKKILSEDVPEVQKDFHSNENLSKDAKSIVVEFSKEDTSRLRNDVNHAFHTEINDILLTALALSLKSWTGNEKFFVNLEGHGREVLTNNVNISRTVGWFTSIYPIMLDVHSFEDKGLLIKQIKEMLRKIPNKGIGFGVLKYLSPMKNESGLCHQREPQISLNFLGEYGNELKKPFELSTLAIGESVNPESARTHEIEILGKIVNGKLQFQFEYSRFQYSHSSIEQLSLLFKSHLTELINFCTMKEEAEHSPSDFGDDHNLSFEELEGLQNLIEAKLK
jgi:bacitracin synthase 3